jgi:signal peptidase II
MTDIFAVNIKKKLFPWILMISFLILDQGSKMALRHMQDEFFDIPVTSCFRLTASWNDGLSWGFLPHLMQSQMGNLFAFLNVLLSIFLLISGLFQRGILMWCTSWPWAWILITAGAIGNTLDRILFKAVFDFLHLHWGYFSFPIFNVADVLLTLGGIILFYQYLEKECS